MVPKPRVIPLVILIAFATLLSVSIGQFADDPGVGWHLKTGEYILENSAVPKFDPFLFVTTPRAWVSDQWLSDCLIAFVYKLGKFPLLYALGTVLFVCTFFSLLYPALRNTEGSAIPALIATFFAFKIAQVHFILRPVLFAFFCFALLFRLIAPLYQTGELLLPLSSVTKIIRRLAMILPILFLLWANLHPSFSIGLIFLSLIVLGLSLDQFFFTQSWSRQDLLARRNGLALVLVISALATLINPAGWALHQSILELSGNAFFMNYHQEWLSPDFNKSEGQFVEWFLYGTILSLLIGFRARRASMVDFLLICFFTHAALDAVRFLPFFGIVLSPYLSRSMRIFSELGELPGFKRLALAYQAIEERERRAWIGMPVALCSFILVGWTLTTGHLPLFTGVTGPSLSKYPYQEVAELRSVITTEQPAIVAAESNFGGFLTWQGEGKIKALIDDRNTLVGEKLYQDFESGLAGKGDWQGYFRSIGATHLMLRKSDPLAQRLKANSELQLVTEGPIVSIFSLKL